MSLAGEFVRRHTFLRRASLDTIWAAALAIRGAFSKTKCEGMIAAPSR
jgi:hypothetical protein